MVWFESPALDFAGVVFAVVTVAITGYGYYAGKIPRSMALFALVGGMGMMAATTEGAGEFLSLPDAVSGMASLIAGLSFIGLFLYWVSMVASETAT